MRNPFRKQDENVRPSTSINDSLGKDDSNKSIDVKEKEPVEYQLSEINDSGVYLPPSPVERKSFWGTTSSRSTTSSSLHRPVYDANEPFNMSRESFDSYRRSFDISARSPIMQPLESRQRSSLDIRTFQPLPRSSNSFQRPLQVPQTQTEEEDRFEDVNIDEPKPLQQAPKKRGIFARMVEGGGNTSSSNEPDTNGRPTSSHEKVSTWHHFGVGGRKRGQSGQGAELGSMPLPPPHREETPKPEKQSQHAIQPPTQAQPKLQPSAMPQARNSSTQLQESTRPPSVKSTHVSTANGASLNGSSDPVANKEVDRSGASTAPQTEKYAQAQVNGAGSKANLDVSRDPVSVS